MRVTALLALLPLISACPARRFSPVPLYAPRDGHAIEGKYIVRMKSNAGVSIRSAHVSRLRANAYHEYSIVFDGFAGDLSSEDLENLRNDPDKPILHVDYIEQDAVFTPASIITETGAPWGISRVSANTVGGTTYRYDSSAGAGVGAYVIDTGVEVTHPDFEGCAHWASNFADNSTADEVGHSTHVAGTIGGKIYGMAKKVDIYSVKVISDTGSGSTSVVLAGMDFVVSDSKKRQCPKPVVVNMSLETSRSQAGNDFADTSGFTPASAPKACTVGATEWNDNFASFSNLGPDVDIFAPGVGIRSDYPGGTVKSLEGTSMTSPHVTGLAALLLGLGRGGAASGLCDYIVSTGVKGLITNLPANTANVLAHITY